MDYVEIDTVLSISSSPFTHSFQLLDDEELELPEQFQLVLSVVAGVSSAGVDPEQSVVTVTILDDDGMLVMCVYLVYACVDECYRPSITASSMWHFWKSRSVAISSWEIV